jgi:hypothetical protein
MTKYIPFWGKDPSILLNKNEIFQFWPMPNMNMEEKMNAISRSVIVLSLLGFLFTFSSKFLLMGIITLLVIWFVYRSYGTSSSKKAKEGFYSNGKNKSADIKITNPETLEVHLKSEFEDVTKKNPFNNVLLTQINDDPHRKPAPPSFNPDVHDDINNKTKKMIQYLNPGIKNTNKQLFGDLGERYEFDTQAQWYYYSMPNTKVCNDQGAFADYLYGNMPSARNGNAFALVQDNYRYTLY